MEREMEIRVSNLEDEVRVLREEVYRLKNLVLELAERFPSSREAGRRYEAQRILALLELKSKLK